MISTQHAVTDPDDPNRRAERLRLLSAFDFITVHSYNGVNEHKEELTADNQQMEKFWSRGRLHKHNHCSHMKQAGPIAAVGGMRGDELWGQVKRKIAQRPSAHRTFPTAGWAFLKTRIHGAGHWRQYSF